MNKFTKFIFCAAAALTIPLWVANNAQAKRAVQTPIVVTQPDGTTLTIRMYGDEHFHYTTTADGHLLLSTPDKGYVYAQINADGDVQPSALKAHDVSERSVAEQEFLSSISKSSIEKALIGMQQHSMSSPRMQNRRTGYLLDDSENVWQLGRYDHKYPVIGSPKALVVLVEYLDVPFKTSDPYEYFNDMLNLENFSRNGATGSARDWFIYNSNGMFNPNFDVYGPIKLKHNRRYYGGNDSYGNDSKPEEMVIEAIEALDDEVDFTQYDTNGDGYIDNVFVFYAGEGEADSSKSEAVWPHSYDLEYARPRDTFEYDGVILNHYACSNEIDYQYKRADGIGTFVHEFSHVMGLPDLYATTYSSAVTPSEYSVLDYGPYNNQGRTPPNYSSFERNALGWLTPKMFMEDENIILEPLIHTNDCYLVPTERDTEFFLLEYRQRVGNDTYIPAGGMIVWQIDYDDYKWLYNSVNNSAGHQNVMMLKADNRNTVASLSGDTYPGKTNNTSLGPDTKPAFVSWSKRSVGVTITDIAEEDDVIKFNVTLDDDYNYPTHVGVNDVKVSDKYFELNGISITALKAIDIYTPAGMKVMHLNEGETNTLPGRGFYLIHSEEQTVKLAI